MMNTESFIKKSKKIHENTYDYSLVKYRKSKIPIIIRCKIHGIFQQKPNHHLSSQGCPKCGIFNTSKKNRHSQQQILNKCIEVHGNLYDYSLIDYKNYSTKIKIICNKHGVFEQTPKNHILRKSGCPKCAIIQKANGLKLSQKKFISISKKTHNNKYDYSLVDYVNNKTKIKIICLLHGIFEQIPAHHMKGIGCPHCNDSKGELKIKNFLEYHHISFVRNKTFNDCYDLGKLKFDFYLPKLNLIIEFDGIQHYKPIDVFGGEFEFFNIQRRDKIKNDYCEEKSIQLLRIKYNENINNKLKPILMKDK